MPTESMERLEGPPALLTSVLPVGDRVDREPATNEVSGNIPVIHRSSGAASAPFNVEWRSRVDDCHSSPSDSMPAIPTERAAFGDQHLRVGGGHLPIAIAVELPCALTRGSKPAL